MSILSKALYCKSPTYIHTYSKSPTYKLWTFKDANLCSFVQSYKLAHMSGVHCHVYASSIGDYAFVYFTVQYYIEYSGTVSLLQAWDAWKQV